MRADSVQVRGLKALVLLLLVLYEGHTKEICRTGVKIDQNYREDNEDKTTGRPLYWFDLHRASDGYHPGHLYTFRLHSSSKVRPFSDAVLRVETSNTCGTGELIVNSTYLYQPKNCPQIIMTEYKKPMTNVPFKWKAPRCGCVTFRTTVIRNGESYYYDDEKVSDGHLVKTVCQHGVRVAEQLLVKDDLTTPSPIKRSRVTAKMDRAARLDLLCKITDKLNTVDLLKRPEFIARRELQNSSLIELLNIELALEQRRADINSCCQKEDDNRVRCFDNIRRYRIDQYCGDGQPRIPFVVKKTEYMKSREENCCWRIGESRYQCFGNNKYIPTTLSIDYSLDDSDPANDIADYPTELERFEEVADTNFFKEPLMEEVMDESKKEVEPSTTSQPTTTFQPTTTAFKSTTSTPIPTAPIRYHKPRPRPALSSETNPVRNKITGQGDMGYKSNNLVSTVEKTVNNLKQKLWKFKLKFECCEAGQTYAIKTGIIDVWDRCHAAAREYRSSVVRGKKICSNTFQKCCVEQFLTPTSVVPSSKVRTETQSASEGSFIYESSTITDVLPGNDQKVFKKTDFHTERSVDKLFDDNFGDDGVELKDSHTDMDKSNDDDDDDDDDDLYDDDDDDDDDDDALTVTTSRINNNLDYPTEDPIAYTIYKKSNDPKTKLKGTSKNAKSQRSFSTTRTSKTVKERRNRRKGRRHRHGKRARGN